MIEYDSYAPWYDTQNPMDDVDFYLESVARFGGPVLEAGCGTGRLVIPLAREGYQVTGLDISGEMLKRARLKIAKEEPAVQQRISVAFADIRQFQLLPLFNTVIFGCNTFQHLLTLSDQDRALSCAHRHMADQGRLFLQTANVRCDEHAPDVLYYRGRQFHPETGETIDISYSFQFDYQYQIQLLHLFLDAIDAEDRLTRKKVNLTFRYFNVPELERMLDGNGFAIEELCGDFQRNPLRHDSPWIVIQARKKTC